MVLVAEFIPVSPFLLLLQSASPVRTPQFHIAYADTDAPAVAADHFTAVLVVVTADQIDRTTHENYDKLINAADRRC